MDEKYFIFLENGKSFIDTILLISDNCFWNFGILCRSEELLSNLFLIIL